MTKRPYSTNRATLGGSSKPSTSPVPVAATAIDGINNRLLNMRQRLGHFSSRLEDLLAHIEPAPPSEGLGEEITRDDHLYTINLLSDIETQLNILGGQLRRLDPNVE